MPMPKKNPPSPYSQLNFVGLHIKRATKDRLNFAKAQWSARAGKSYTHDDLINALLDAHAESVLEVPLLEPAR